MHVSASLETWIQIFSGSTLGSLINSITNLRYNLCFISQCSHVFEFN